MTDIELIINYIYGERENIECLREDIEATNNPQTKELFERDITDTEARINILINITKKLKALEILKEKRVDMESFLNSLNFNRPRETFNFDWDCEKKQLTKKEYDLLKEVLEEESKGMEEKEFTQEAKKRMALKIEKSNKEIELLKSCLATYVVNYEEAKKEMNDYKKISNFFTSKNEELEKENEELKKQLASCDRGYDGYDKSFQNDYLTYKEWKYLKGVIEPFREMVEYIEKTDSCDNSEYICIYLKDEYIELPNFEEGKHYKGMQRDIHYTLEDLGL